jgi:ParB-like chromosome segregation protein Spo0J
MKVSKLKPNPSNPRVIKDEKFKKLVKSLQEFPEMMEKRPMVCVTDVDGKMYPLGGNMRLRAIQELGMKEISDAWVMMADDWTEDKRRKFTIKDNVGFGEWNWDQLANEWDAELLQDWGLDLPMFMDEPTGDELIGEEKNKPATMKITFTSPEQLQKAEIDIQELLDRKYEGAYFSVSAGEI